MKKHVIAALLLLMGVTFQIALARAQQTAPPPPSGPAQPGTYLEREVRHQLVLLPYYSIFDDLSFRVDGTTVTLMGQVVRPTLKSDAGNVAKRIEGVDKVINNIEVLPLSDFDDRIRRASYRAIYGDPTLERYALQAVGPIHIIVNNGHVTLKGVVANAMDKNIAGIRANGVPGVFSVDNQLQVEEGPK
jgi:hyperosmotically inducible periplasmic protein